jgi:hypothetical protein
VAQRGPGRAGADTRLSHGAHREPQRRRLQPCTCVSSPRSRAAGTNNSGLASPDMHETMRVARNRRKPLRLHVTQPWHTPLESLFWPVLLARTIAHAPLQRTSRRSLSRLAPAARTTARAASVAARPYRNPPQLPSRAAPRVRTHAPLGVHLLALEIPL